MNAQHEAALILLRSGLSIIPIRPDGSKAPTVKWERYQHERASEHDVRRWFASRHSGVGVIGGVISGGLEVMDFDEHDVFTPWENLVHQLQEGLLDRLPLVWTPTGGFHVYYRCGEIGGNQKLARRHPPDKPPEVRIETRGEGGYVLSPFCHADCHPLKQKYVLLRGDLADIPRITLDERHLLLNAARAFDEYVEPPTPTPKPSPSTREGDERPGDAFARTHQWNDILTPHGWRAVHQQGEMTYWKRPDKRDRGWSASTGHDGHDTLYVFTTNAYPFVEKRGYSKFTAWVLLNFRGDFHAAAKALTREKTHGRQAVAVPGGRDRFEPIHR